MERIYASGGSNVENAINLYTTKKEEERVLAADTEALDTSIRSSEIAMASYEQRFHVSFENDTNRQEHLQSLLNIGGERVSSSEAFDKLEGDYVVPQESKHVDSDVTHEYTKNNNGTAAVTTDAKVTETTKETTKETDRTVCDTYNTNGVHTKSAVEERTTLQYGDFLVGNEEKSQNITFGYGTTGLDYISYLNRNRSFLNYGVYPGMATETTGFKNFMTPNVYEYGEQSFVHPLNSDYSINRNITIGSNLVSGYNINLYGRNWADVINNDSL